MEEGRPVPNVQMSGTENMVTLCMHSLNVSTCFPLLS